MSLKIVFFICLIALTFIEAKHFLKRLNQKENHFLSSVQTSERVLNLVRKRRDAAESKSSESVELTDETAASLMKFFVAAAWEGEKQGMLSELITDMSDSDCNVTVVGWQRVVDDQDKVQEIRTIQFVIPPKPENKPSNIVQEDSDADDDRMLPHKEINEMKEMFEPMAAVGIPASITMEEFSEDGKRENLLYMDKDELYSNSEGFSIYNKTSTVSQQEVSDFIAKLKPGALGKPTVLKYDVDGHLIVDQSHIRPQILGAVMDHYEAPDNILREAPEIIARVAYQNPQNEIAKNLAAEYNKAYPEYKWRVLDNTENFYVTRDVAVTLSYDNFDFDESSDVSYYVYGVKKSTK